MIGSLHHIEIVLNDHEGVSTLEQGIEGMEQSTDVVEVQSRGGFVEDEECGHCALLSEIVSQFDTLIFTSRESRGRLSEFDVAQSHILQGTEAIDNLFLAIVVEEFDGLVHRHLQDVVDVFTFKLHLQHLILEAMSVAGFAFKFEVCHKLHLHLHRSCTFTLFASSAIGIEREERRFHLHLLCERLLSHEFANLVIGLDIGDGIGARRASDGVLVYKIYRTNGIEIALQRHKFARTFGCFVQVSLNGRIEDVAHEGRFARTRHACHHGEDIEGEIHVDAFEVVFPRSLDGDFAVPLSARSGEFDALTSEEIVERVARQGRFA